jgi:lysophospholipase L1-like esterase
MPRRAPLAVLLAALLVTTASPVAGGEVAQAERPLRYVAMGDSYSAASGVLPLDPTAPPQCLRSTRNYPHVVAEELGARLTDVTCGAAETADYRQEQYPGVAPQLDALGRRTELVTMTIGGNDNGVFIGAIAKCGTAGLSTAGTGSPCRDRYGKSFVRTIRNRTAPALVRALRAVHRNAPRAQVAILGYPWIVPTGGGCFTRLPVAEGDVPYLRNLQRVLNLAVERAAARTGSTYVDLSRVSDGHDACQDLGVRWVEPVVTSTNPVVVHPNALGERRMARRTLRVLAR